jgi:glutathione S-transferase
VNASNAHAQGNTTMITLFSNGFSPFARKVAMALDYKALAHETLEALNHENRDRLLRANPRAEVPVLVDDGVCVVNSSDILAFLEHKYPDKPLFPIDLKARVDSRALERLADTRIDAILLTSSIWSWAERDDEPLPGLKEAAQHDLDGLFARIESILADYPAEQPFGHWTNAEFAMWPHLAALRALGLNLDQAAYPKLAAWFAAMRRDSVFSSDGRRTAEFMKTLTTATNFERKKIFWRGDRIEWLLARGFHGWFMKEITEERVLWPE